MTEITNAERLDRLEHAERFLRGWKKYTKYCVKPVTRFDNSEFYDKYDTAACAAGASKVQRALTILSTERPSLRTIRRRFNEAEKIAGIDHFKPHWWRHTLATKLVAKGYSFTDISYLLGNTEAVCQTVYGRSNHTRLREMVDAVAR